MPWPRRLAERSCADCDGLLVDDWGGLQPVYTWALPLRNAPRFWEHHRRRPETFDLSTASRFECTRCGRIVMLGTQPAGRRQRAPARALRLPGRPRFSPRSS